MKNGVSYLERERELLYPNVPLTDPTQQLDLLYFSCRFTWIYYFKVFKISSVESTENK
jgi:hypothetical protein